MSNGGKEQQFKNKNNNAVYSWPKVGHSQREEGGSTWFLKLPEAPSKNSTQLVDAKSKTILLTVRDDQLLFMLNCLFCFLFFFFFLISQDLAKWWTTEVTPGNLAPRYIICCPKLPQSRLESDKPALKCNYQNLQSCSSLHRHRTSVNIYIFSVDICYALWAEKHIYKHVNTDHPFIYTINCHTVCMSSKN